jgi:YggT family protein
MKAFFDFLGTVVTLYSMACFIRVILTWFPQAHGSPFERFLRNICDPYLNIFRKVKFLRTSTLDFSPVVALAVLVGVSGVFSNLADGGKFSLGAIIAALLETVYGAVSSIIIILIIMAIVRLVALLAAPSSASSFWAALDKILKPILTPVAVLFSNAARFSWKNTLIIGVVIFFVLNIALRLVVSLLAGVFKSLPF